MQTCIDCPDPVKCLYETACVGVGGFAPRIQGVTCGRCGQKMDSMDEAEGCEDFSCPFWGGE